MRQLKAFGAIGVIVLAGSLTVRADVWDLGTATDDTSAGTANHLVHGSSQQHDLAAKGTPAVADLDFFVLRDAPFSSYELVVDGTTGDLNLDSALNVNFVLRNGADTGTTHNATQIEGGQSLAIRWVNNSNTIVPRFANVKATGGIGCAAECTTDDRYSIRLRNTTIAVPRFNNANGQVTVLLIQNSTSGPVAGNVYYWDAAGVQLTSQAINLVAKRTLVLNLSSNIALQDTSGALTVAHDGGYGGLSVKAIALDPATGFSFDSPGNYRP